MRGASAFRHLVAKLPPRARSVYYRDEIGNISTSHLWGDSKKVDTFTSCELILWAVTNLISLP